MKTKLICLLTGLCLTILTALPAQISAAPYFEGKAISIIVGTGPATGHDRIARFLAKHLIKYIPGKPAIIVQNMPGASSMVAANQVYNKSKPDGTTLLATHRGLAFMQLYKVDGVKYDIRKFSFLGSAAAESNILLIRNDLPYKTFEDLQKEKKQLFFGGGGPGSVTTQMTELSIDYLGLNIKVVEYKSAGEIYLAIERKELDGLWTALNSARPFIDRGLLRPLVRSWVVQKGIENLPVNEDLTKDPRGKILMALLGRTAMMGRLYLAPPNTPPTVMNILKDAFAKTLLDSELQAETEKAQMELRYVPDEECLKLVNFIFTQPPEVVKAFSKYVSY
jgi:tripartite-type tricarboxylate transporter receptor subunit TctC